MIHLDKIAGKDFIAQICCQIEPTGIRKVYQNRTKTLAISAHKQYCQFLGIITTKFIRILLQCYYTGDVSSLKAWNVARSPVWHLRRVQFRTSKIFTGEARFWDVVWNWTANGVGLMAVINTFSLSTQLVPGSISGFYFVKSEFNYIHIYFLSLSQVVYPVIRAKVPMSKRNNHFTTTCKFQNIHRLAH